MSVCMSIVRTTRCKLKNFEWIKNQYCLEPSKIKFKINYSNSVDEYLWIYIAITVSYYMLGTASSLRFSLKCLLPNLMYKFYQ